MLGEPADDNSSLRKGDRQMLSRFNQTLILSMVILIGFGMGESRLLAQGDVGGGDTGGQVTDPGQGQTGQNAGPGNLQTNAGGRGEGVGDLGEALELDETEDNRNQGFVGAAATRIQEQGFVGRPGQLVAPPLSDEGTLGGGVNDSVQSTININAGGGTGGGAAGFGAATNGVTITRRSMRSRVRPSFSAPRFTGTQVSTRFNKHFVLQPGSKTQPASYSINIQDRTAVLNGSVQTSAESERLVRQLRLEPGVYKIVNQLQILN
jgi:hypothetical protein